MNELTIFENEVFGKIRTATLNDTPMFCLADVCKALGLAQPAKVKERLNAKGVHSIHTLTQGGTQNLLFIDESNLYKTIFQSRKQEAERFSDWVTSDVLPSIRKTGGYIAGQESMSDSELMAKALLVAQRQIEERNKLIASQEQIIGELSSKAEYVDIILNNKGLVTITQIAKDYGMSGANLNRILSDLHIQYKQSGQWLLYSAHQNKGWTHSKTINITRSDGRRDVVMETKWTQKGRLALYELLKKNGILPTVERE